MVVRYTARDSEVPRVEAALKNMLEPSRAEPGNIDYQVFRDPKDPAVFVLAERYADEAAFEAHRSSAHFQKWVIGEVMPCLTERVPFFGVPLGD